MSGRKRSPSAGLISGLCQRKGLDMSSSVSNISFRYHPEDEELDDDNYETSSSLVTSSITVKPEEKVEDATILGPSGDGSTTVLGRLRMPPQETDGKWKLFHKITKSVEEKFEGIKTERLKNQRQRRTTLTQMDASSVSDSEEQSESSQPSVSDKSTKSVPDSSSIQTNTVVNEESRESDGASGSHDSQRSSPDRSTTPVPCPDNPPESFTNYPLNREKGVRGAIKRKKGKTKSDQVVDKTSVTYSRLCDNETDSESVEVAQEVDETMNDPSETKLKKELEKLAHPTLFQRVYKFVLNWHLILLPVIAVLVHWCIQVPHYMSGLVSGVIGLLVLQRVMKIITYMLGLSETPIKQLCEMLPLTEVPIFRRSIYESDIEESLFEGWMNEYSGTYHPGTYHITLTDSVYVRLEGTKLRLSTPRSKIPKRALWNQPRYSQNFNRERLFDITNCKVELRPKGLIHRRIWSKKYPICIILAHKSKLGVRHRNKNEETIDESTPWIEEEKYNFETVSEDSDEEGSREPPQDLLTVTPQMSETSLESLLPADEEDEAEDGEEDFIKVIPSTNEESLLFLFARTDRDKEIWFRRLVGAVNRRSSPTKMDADYISYMLRLSQRTTAQLPSTKEMNAKTSLNSADLSISLDMMWLNAFFGRVLYDIFHDSDKLEKIQEKIQRKLSTIKLPLFFEKLEVSHLDLGTTVPIIQRTSRPILNSQGIWVDLDVVYEGGFKMTVDTKLNLNRIKQMQAESPSSESPKNGSPAKSPTPTPQSELPRKSAVYDSAVEDSAETSSEEPDMSRLQEPQAGPLAQTKLLRLLDKVAMNKYVQQVVDYKYIKKFVAGNNLQLVVEVKGLLGTLVLNIPPPPTDRLWYGFRTNPKLWLSAQPKFGQHAVHVISRIIEKKLSLEFQRLLVLPNMDDFLIPVMNHSIPSFS